MDAKNQHYVPRFLLENFAISGTDRLFVFDKHSDRSFPTNIRNAAAEGKLYDLTFKDQRWSLEPSLARFEDEAASVIAKLNGGFSLLSISDIEKVTIARFLALQVVRGPQQRDLIRQINESLHKIVGKKLRVPEAENPVSRFSDSELQRMHLEGVRTSSKFAPVLLRKHWFLLKLSSSQTAFTSDQPVVVQNRLDAGFRGNLGLECRGIEIYLPLSNSLVLALICPSHIASWRMTQTKLEILQSSGTNVANKHPIGRRLMEDLLKSIQTGKPVAVDEQILENLNFLQIAGSHRYVFSANDDFSLVRDVLAKAPDLKRGPQLVAS